MKRIITKGSIVKYKNGWMEVRAVFTNTVNLGPIFQGRTTIKGVAINEVTPDYDGWHNEWTQSETYMSM